MKQAPERIDVSVRQAIEALIHEHAWLIDHGQAERVADLFVEDARLLGVGPDKIGRPAIAQWARTRAAMRDRRSRHVQTNIRLEPEAGDRIRGTVILTLYRHDGPEPGSAAPLLIGEYEDIYVKCADERWRFLERRLSPVFGGA